MIFENLLVVTLIVFASVFGGCIRRLSGFGGALIMTPLFMWIFPVPFLIPIVLSAEIFGGVLLWGILDLVSCRKRRSDSATPHSKQKPSGAMTLATVVVGFVAWTPFAHIAYGVVRA